MASLLSIDLLNKKPEPFHYLNIIEDWELEDHDEEACTDEQLILQEIEVDDEELERRTKGKVLRRSWWECIFTPDSASHHTT